MSGYQVPDAVEPVVGWRSWRLHQGTLLPVSNQGTVWTAGARTEARCDRPGVGRWEWKPVSREHHAELHADLAREGYASLEEKIKDGGGVTGSNYIANQAANQAQAAQNQMMYASSAASYMVTSASSVNYLAVQQNPYAAANTRLPHKPKLLLPDGMEWLLDHTVQKHDAPDKHCTCGLYAVTSPDLAPGADVFGRVSLWGKIVPGDQGYRAQYGYPKDLFIAVGARVKTYKKQADDTRDLLTANYGVSCDLVTGTAEAVQLAAANDEINDTDLTDNFFYKDPR